jgi:hypothetical protein
MGKRLTVILGAGASCDCTSIGVTRIDKDYRPPLTSGIFEGRRPFQTILEKYPKARTLASTIDLRVNRGEPLEAVLRGLRDSKEEHIIRQFRQIPLYLQELFGEISDHFTSEPANYSHLVNRLLASDIERVAFVTLNYDLLLEKSLGTIMSNSGIQWRPKKLSFYLEQDRKWMLIKLHGSVNWGRLIQTKPMVQWTHERELDVIDGLSATLDMSLSSDITMLASHQQRWKQILNVKNLYYPAISVPVEGKYEFVCPMQHIDALKDFLASCHNYLLIGISGRDMDLIDLLRANIRKCATLGVVEDNPRDAEEVAERFDVRVSQFARADVRKFYTEGFSEFTKAKRNPLDDFLAYVES